MMLLVRYRAEPRSNFIAQSYSQPAQSIPVASRVTVLFTLPVVSFFPIYPAASHHTRLNRPSYLADAGGLKSYSKSTFVPSSCSSLYGGIPPTATSPALPRPFPTFPVGKEWEFAAVRRIACVASVHAISLARL
jgi:hypothetical protein